MPGKYKSFSAEFRDKAARMVVETSRPIAEVARELGISETSLGNWVRAYRARPVFRGRGRSDAFRYPTPPAFVSGSGVGFALRA